MEATVSLLENDHVCHELKVLIDFLEHLNNDFRHVVAPLLSFLWLVVPVLECGENKIVDLLLDLLVHFDK